MMFLNNALRMKSLELYKKSRWHHDHSRERIFDRQWRSFDRSFFEDEYDYNDRVVVKCRWKEETDL